MVRMSISAALALLRFCDDDDCDSKYKALGRRLLAERYGIEEKVFRADIEPYIVKLLKCETNDAGNEKFRTLLDAYIKTGDLPSHIAAEILVDLDDVRHKLPDNTLLELVAYDQQCGYSVMLKAYEMYVYDIMHKRFRTFASSVRHADDMKQVGLGALVQAFKTWDPDRGSFSTYSKFILIKAMSTFSRSELNSSGHNVTVRRAIEKARAEILDMNRYTEEDADNPKHIAILSGLPENVVRKEMLVMQRSKTVSLPEGYEWLVPDKLMKNPLDIVVEDELQQKLRELISNFPEDMKTAICLRYYGDKDGSCDNGQMQINTVAKIMKLKDSDVKQLIERGIKILRKKMVNDDKHASKYAENQLDDIPMSIGNVQTVNEDEDFLTVSEFDYDDDDIIEIGLPLE